jgi:hypothetical protein
MKSLLNLRNRVAVASVFMGLLFTASSFTFGPTEDIQLAGDPPQKKVQRVKVIVNKDGKEIKIDTTFNMVDEKMVRYKVDSLIQISNKDHSGAGKQDVLILHGGKQMKCTVTDNGSGPGEEEFNIFIQEGDSGKMKNMRKVIRVNGRNNNIITEDVEGSDMIPPPPPMPPHAIIMHKQLKSDPFAFDTRDESVVSYEKKDLGNGLERITIVRKIRNKHPQKKEINVKVQAVTGTTETKK